MVYMRDVLGIGGIQDAFSGNNKMEQIVVAGSRPVRMERLAAFPSVLEKRDIDISFVRKNIK